MEIKISGQIELIENILKGEKTTSHLVSIGNPGNGIRNREDSIMPLIFEKSYKKILRLAFFDVESKSHLGPIRPRRIPLKRDVKKAIRFFNKTKNKATGYTIHCWRGISRSTAIALGYLYLIHGDEQIAINELKRIRPEASPLPLIVKYFDKLLGCNLTSVNNQLRQIRHREMQEWFLNEIEDFEEVEAFLEKVE